MLRRRCLVPKLVASADSFRFAGKEPISVPLKGFFAWSKRGIQGLLTCYRYRRGTYDATVGSPFQGTLLRSGLEVPHTSFFLIAASLRWGYLLNLSVPRRNEERALTRRWRPVADHFRKVVLLLSVLDSVNAAAKGWYSFPSCGPTVYSAYVRWWQAVPLTRAVTHLRRLWLAHCGVFFLTGLCEVPLYCSLSSRHHLALVGDRPDRICSS